MSKKIRSIFSLAVALCMIFSLAAVNVSAAPSVPRNATISLSNSTGEAGDTISLSVFLDDTDNLVSLGYKIQFNPDVFYIDNTDNRGIPVSTDSDWMAGYNAKKNTYHTWATLVITALPEDGQVIVGCSDTYPVDPSTNLEIGKFNIQVKDTAPAGDTTITLINTETLDDEADGGLGAAMIFTPVTFTVLGDDPEPTTYELTIGETTNGSIDLDPVGGTYDEDEEVTVTAVPDEGYRFVEFTGDLTGTTNPATITMDGDKTIGATFELIPPTQYTLTIDSEIENGSITLSPVGGTYNEDTEVTVTAVPAEGYEFVEFTGASTATTNPVTITMDGDKTIGATFELIPPATDDPVIKVSSGTVTEGETVSVEVTVDNLPETATGVGFGLAYDKDVLEVAKADIVANEDIFYQDSPDVTVANGTLGFGGLFIAGADLEGEILIATITFTAKDGSAGTTDLEFINAEYGTITIVDKVDGSINVVAASDPAFEAADTAITLYEEAVENLATMADVTTAIGLRDGAESALAAVDAGEDKDSLIDRMDNANADLQDFILANLDDDSVNMDIIDELVDNAIEENIDDYKKAFTLAGYMPLVGDDALTIGDVEAIVDAVNSFDPATRGYVTDGDNITTDDANLIRAIFLDTAQDITIDQVLRADINNDGEITVTDIVDALLDVARRMQEQG